MNDIKQAITDRLLDEGFSSVGFAPSALGEREQRRLQEFVANGEHGTMAWMERHLERRLDPKALMAEAKTVIVVGLNYAPEADPMLNLERKCEGNISVYARNADYHDVMKKRLRRCASAIAVEYDCDVKIFVDTAPLAEKPLAAMSGVGWQGKHSNVVSREFGSWLFLGEILTDLALPYDDVIEDNCGSCRRCLDVCPTGAFDGAYRLDARRCISYLTIEHDGIIPEEFRDAIGNRIYGCDDCLAVCPWNKFAVRGREVDFWFRTELEHPLLSDFLVLDEVGFRGLFRGSPVKRIGWERFMRNVLIASGNSGDIGLLGLVEKYCGHESAVLSESACWARDKLSKG